MLWNSLVADYLDPRSTFRAFQLCNNRLVVGTSGSEWLYRDGK